MKASNLSWSGQKLRISQLSLSQGVPIWLFALLPKLISSVAVWYQCQYLLSRSTCDGANDFYSIQSIFSNLVGKEEADKIQVIANDAEILEDGHFKIKYRHPDSHYGHDKSKALKPYADLPKDKRPVGLICSTIKGYLAEKVIDNLLLR